MPLRCFVYLWPPRSVSQGQASLCFNSPITVKVLYWFYFEGSKPTVCVIFDFPSYPIMPLFVRPQNHTLVYELGLSQLKTDCSVNSSGFNKSTEDNC